MTETALIDSELPIFSFDYSGSIQCPGCGAFLHKGENSREVKKGGIVYFIYECTRPYACKLKEFAVIK